jgi:hypothetical protein
VPKPAQEAIQPPNKLVPGAISLGVNQPGCEADHSLSGTEVKVKWSCVSTPPYAFMICAGTTVSLSGRLSLLLLLYFTKIWCRMPRRGAVC